MKHITIIVAAALLSSCASNAVAEFAKDIDPSVQDVCDEYIALMGGEADVADLSEAEKSDRIFQASTLKDVVAATAALGDD